MSQALAQKLHRPAELLRDSLCKEDCESETGCRCNDASGSVVRTVALSFFVALLHRVQGQYHRKVAWPKAVFQPTNE